MEWAVKKALGTSKFQATGRGGSGCISSGSSYITDNGTVFVKTNNKPNALTMFEGELAGLEAILATKTLKCPKPLKIVQEGSDTALVMENLNMIGLSSSQQGKLGEQLARMHLTNSTLLEKAAKEESRINSGLGDELDYSQPVSKFGFYVTTCCGYLSQDNTWHQDWTTKTSAPSGYADGKGIYLPIYLPEINNEFQQQGDRDLNDIWPLCVRKIEDHLSTLSSIVPALVHGDLWSGNVASAENDEPVIYDPAAFYGHSEYDFGIAIMFGGFCSNFYDGYFKIIPKADGFSKREAIYEVFHHLNHWNHFGSGYKGSTISLMKKISKF